MSLYRLWLPVKLSKECGMKKLMTVGFTLLAFPMGVGIAAATSSGGHPGCKPSHNTPQKCRTTSTVTVTTPGTTITQVETVTLPATTVTVPVSPPSPPTVVVTPGPVNNTVTITITINGVPTSVTVPGSMPGSEPVCVNTTGFALLGPLPLRYSKVKRVSVAINGKHEATNLLPGRFARIPVPTACGTYPIVINDIPNVRKIRPVLRIWQVDAGKKLIRAGFPLPDPPIGLS
jgi:hypothetical protein